MNNTTDPVHCPGYGTPGLGFGLSVKWQIFYGTLCASIAFIGIVGNATVVIVCLYYESMRSIPSLFISNLAVADFLLCLLNVPMTSFLILTQHWPFGPDLCVFNNFIASTPVVASVLTMTCIAIDRYIAIVHPMRPRMRRKTAYLIIVFVWASAATVSSPALRYSIVFDVPGTTAILCQVVFSGDIWTYPTTSDLTYDIAYMVITYLVPLLTLMVAYGLVANALWGKKSIGEPSKEQRKSLESNQRLVKALICVMVMFLICWAPYQCWFVMIKINECIQQMDNIAHLFSSSFVMAMSSSIWNPIIYIILNKKFRDLVKRMFRWIPCLKHI